MSTQPSRAPFRHQRLMTVGQRLSQLAAVDPDRPAVVFARTDRSEVVLTRSQFWNRCEAVRQLLIDRGYEQPRLVGIGYPNSPEHLAAATAAWMLGACVLPLNPRLAQRERSALLEIAQPDVVFADWPDTAISCITTDDLADLVPPEPWPERVPNPGKAILSGGSTGRSKIIVSPGPWLKEPGRAAGDLGEFAGFRPDQVQLVTTQLSHNMPFSWSHTGLFDGHCLVLMERFEATHAVELIQRHRVNWAQFVPVIMQRLANEPSLRNADLSSIDSIWHCGAYCPPWLKRFWINLLGPERVRESFGAAENIGHTNVTGHEWLQRPGTVGRPVNCEIRVLDENGREVPPGEVGEIYMRPTSTVSAFEYLGSAPPRMTDDGFISVGDLGFVDDDGYVFYADRRTDMIITGGINVYPSEVEAVLSEHPSVQDVAVIPLADQTWGKRVHAVIEPVDPDRPPQVEELMCWCRERLSPYKRPKSYEFVRRLPREATGKIRRSALVAAREEAAEQRANVTTG